MHAFPVPAVLACATSAWLPYLVWQPAEAQLKNAFMIGLCSKFYEAKLIRNLVIVEINIGKESHLADFQGHFDS